MHRIGLIGAGGIARTHLPALLELGADVVVHSLAGSAQVARRYEIREAPTLEDLLATVDIVDICTPTATHFSLLCDAIAAGKGVICEKPVARSLREAVEVAERARTAGVSVYPGHVVRFFPAYRALKTATENGRVGSLAVLRFSRGGQAPARDSWFFDEAQSGGIIFDQLVHDIDQARWIAGEVVQVYAVQNPPTLEGRLAHEVSAHVSLTHANGAISYIQGMWGPDGVAFHTSFTVAGDSGTLTFDSQADAGVRRDLVGSIDPDASYLPPTSPGEDPYLAELREFLSAFDGGPQPRVSLADGVAAVGIAEAACESVITGMAVDFRSGECLSALGGERR